MKCLAFALPFALSIAAACRQASPPAEAVQQRPAGQTTTVSIGERPAGRPAQPQHPAPSQNITIDSVELGNPLTVKGRARTFENNVSLRVRDVKGAVVAETFTTSRGEMGSHNPYEASLWLTADPGGHVTVEALEYSAKDGSETNLVVHDMAYDVPGIETILYFPDASCTGVNAYRRMIPKSVLMARLLIEALVVGPTAAERGRGATAPFPRGSRVQSVNLREGVLTADFNERLQNVGGSCQAQMIRASLTQTLSRLPSVRHVVITAAGSEQLALQP